MCSTLFYEWILYFVVKISIFCWKIQKKRKALLCKCSKVSLVSNVHTVLKWNQQILLCNYIFLTFLGCFIHYLYAQFLKLFCYIKKWYQIRKILLYYNAFPFQKVELKMAHFWEFSCAKFSGKKIPPFWLLRVNHIRQVFVFEICIDLFLFCFIVNNHVHNKMIVNTFHWFNVLSFIFLNHLEQWL